MTILRALGAAVVAMVVGTSLAQAEMRVALVIGNGAYENVAHLVNPTNDSKLIADALTQDGFGVTLADNLGREALVRALSASRYLNRSSASSNQRSDFGNSFVECSFDRAVASPHIWNSLDWVT
jgi:hypothetical protein